MLSDKRNSITTRAMGSISSLFNIASSRDVPFCQPLQLQYSHYGCTKAYLGSSLFLISFSSTMAHRWQFVLAPLISPQYCSFGEILWQKKPSYNSKHPLFSYSFSFDCGHALLICVALIKGHMQAFWITYHIVSYSTVVLYIGIMKV